MLKNLSANNVFCIAIGGIGVSGLAELLHQNGVTVFGSDLSKNAQTKRLQSLGITVFDHHDAKNIDGADLVVYSSAVKQDNPERVAAIAKTACKLSSSSTSNCPVLSPINTFSPITSFFTR